MKQRAPKSYNVHEAKTHLSRLLDQVAAGDEVIIAKAGVPVARLVPIVVLLDQRPLGTEQGRVFIAEDFDAPLPADLLDHYEA